MATDYIKNTGWLETRLPGREPEEMKGPTNKDPLPALRLSICVCLKYVERKRERYFVSSQSTRSPCRHPDLRRETRGAPGGASRRSGPGPLPGLDIPLITDVGLLW